MEILVVSDTHGKGRKLYELIEAKCGIDGVFFLGDGISDMEYCADLLYGKTFAGVKGNCDSFFGRWNYSYTDELFINLGAYTVMLTHGHLLSVKSGTERAIKYAAQRGADILLYGHTHVSDERYIPAGQEIDGYILEKPIWVMNPGSLGRPQNGNGSYGILGIRNNSVLISHGTL